jgi:hypothetical protein
MFRIPGPGGKVNIIFGVLRQFYILFTRDLHRGSQLAAFALIYKKGVDFGFSLWYDLGQIVNR